MLEKIFDISILDINYNLDFHPLYLNMKHKKKVLLPFYTVLFSISLTFAIMGSVFLYKTKETTHTNVDGVEFTDSAFEQFKNNKTFGEYVNKTYLKKCESNGNKKVPFKYKNTEKREALGIELVPYWPKEDMRFINAPGDGTCFYHAVLYTFYPTFKENFKHLLDDNSVKYFVSDTINNFWREKAKKLLEDYDNYEDMSYKDAMTFVFYFKMIY